MLRSLTLYLLLSNLFVLCFSSCRYSHYKVLQNSSPTLISNTALTPVIPANGTVEKYMASIDVLNKHFTGILILKQTDSLTRHMVFVTELGMKMFDFEMKDTSITAVYVFEPLNKPKLIGVLKQDFKTILLLDLYGKTAQIVTDKEKSKIYAVKTNKNSSFCTYQNNNELILQETFLKRKRSTKTAYVFNQESRTYAHIQFKQYGLVKIHIELTEIPGRL